MSKKERELSNTVREQAREVTNTKTLESAAHRAVVHAFTVPLSAVDQARETYERACDVALGAPEAKRAAIEGEFLRFAARVIELRRNLDGRGLIAESAALYRSVTELARAAPAPAQTLDALMARHQRDLVACGWKTAEVEFACVDLVRTKESLVSFDGLGITTSARRRVTREWLREVNSPRESPYREKFLAQFPPINGGEQHSEVKNDEL